METSHKETLTKPTLPEYQPFFKSLLALICKGSLTKQLTSLNWPILLVPVLAGLEKFHCTSLFNAEKNLKYLLAVIED
jgi:hypothetical protein